VKDEAGIFAADGKRVPFFNVENQVFKSFIIVGDKAVANFGTGTVEVIFAFGEKDAVGIFADRLLDGGSPVAVLTKVAEIVDIFHFDSCLRVIKVPAE
jgi:hypothetical protein